MTEHRFTEQAVMDVLSEYAAEGKPPPNTDTVTAFLRHNGFRTVRTREVRRAIDRLAANGQAVEVTVDVELGVLAVPGTEAPPTIARTVTGWRLT